jgi:hypothetical protein
MRGACYLEYNDHQRQSGPSRKHKLRMSPVAYASGSEKQAERCGGRGWVCSVFLYSLTMMAMFWFSFTASRAGLGGAPA